MRNCIVRWKEQLVHVLIRPGAAPSNLPSSSMEITTSTFVPCRVPEGKIGSTLLLASLRASYSESSRTGGAGVTFTLKGNPINAVT